MSIPTVIKRLLIATGRARYVARGLQPGTRPHTLITPDPDELRAVLGVSQGQQ